MIILGIDPGTARIGWAILETVTATIRVIRYGCITTPEKTSPESRLVRIFNEVGALIDEYNPDALSIESLFFATNAKTAIAVGEARGVILLSAGRKKIPVISYSPLTVKKTITGYGQADKKQVQQMVKQILKLKEIPQPDDTADAVAIALTHAYSYKMKNFSAL
jgi:crossover junction endodeoxyribonuclease RuvC